MTGRLMEGRSMDVDWQADLDRWLAPFVAALRHKTRGRMCPLYVAGLIGPGDRKSVQPMAARAGEVGYDQPKQVASYDLCSPLAENHYPIQPSSVLLSFDPNIRIA